MAGIAGSAKRDARSIHGATGDRADSDPDTRGDAGRDGSVEDAKTTATATTAALANS